MRTPLVAFVFASATAVTASADPLTAPVAAFDKVTLENVGGNVVAHRAGISIPVVTEGELAAPPKVDAKARKLTLAIESACGDARSVDVGFDAILSKLENVAAFRLHRQKKYADAKVGFAKALALDPKNRIAALNLASAEQLLGEADAAIATLGPWLASAPVETYAAIAQDPELAPLLPKPALAAQKAKASGNAVVANARFAGAAFSAERGLLAIERRECGWGADSADACLVEIELFDTAGKPAGTIPLQSFDASNRALIGARAKGAQQALRDLGFKTESLVTGKQTDDKISFPTLKVGVVGSDQGRVTVLRKDTELGHGAMLEHLGGAVWSPSAKLFVIASHRPGREGCEGTDPTMTTAVPVVLP